MVARTEPEPEPSFLSADPTPLVARGLAYLLILGFMAAAIVSVVIRVPETVSGRFVLIPARGTDPIRASQDGTVVRVRVSESQALEKGDPMFVVASQTIGERAAQLGTQETQVRGLVESLVNERKKYETQRLADEGEDRRLRGQLVYLTQKIENIRRMQAIQEEKFRASLDIAEHEVEAVKDEIVLKRRQNGLAKEAAERSEAVYREGILSWQEYSTRQLEATRAAVELQQTDRALEVALLKVRQLKVEHDNQLEDWQLTLNQLERERQEVGASTEKLRHEAAARQVAYHELQRRLQEEREKTGIRISALQRELVHTRNNELTLSAPCSGTVLTLSVKAPGAVVKDGEVLGEVACVGEKLQANLTVPASGAGRLRPGQGVKLLYDAFPYQRHGVRQGTVRWVTPAGVVGRDGPAFHALIDIRDEAIAVQGQLRALLPGMGGTAEIVIGRRSLISFAFEPLRQLRESLRDAPGQP